MIITLVASNFCFGMCWLAYAVIKWERLERPYKLFSREAQPALVFLSFLFGPIFLLCFVVTWFKPAFQAGVSLGRSFASLKKDILPGEKIPKAKVVK